MKKVNPAAAVGLVIVALALLAFSLYKYTSSQASAASMVGLVPPPRSNSPTFAPLEGEHVLSKGGALPGGGTQAAGQQAQGSPTGN
jgi:hypothetical protein